MTELRPELPELPPRIDALHVDARGYPVPWFVQYVDGEPDHRFMDGDKLMVAWERRLCWICGQPLGGPNVTFLIGPMCAVNLVSAEPPSHYDCALFSAKGCPFLSRPHAHRREWKGELEAVNPAGIMLKRNPGVTLVWTARKWTTSLRPVPGGTLFDIGKPLNVEWYAEGRPATRNEVMASINTGLPTLVDLAEQDGDDAVRELGGQVYAALQLVPDGAYGEEEPPGYAERYSDQLLAESGGDAG